MIQLLNKNRLAWRIRATFAGKLPPKEYLTPDIRNTNPEWGDEIFNRAIEKIEFFLPTGHRLILSGMEKYNFFVEAIQAMGRGRTDINAFYFCGKLPDREIVEFWKISNGQIVRDRAPYGREYMGTPTGGWKKGVPGRVISMLEAQ